MYKLKTLTLIAMIIANYTHAQTINFTQLKLYEHQLDDVMEMIDTTELKVKLQEVHQKFTQTPDELNKLRLSIMYHEVALNFSFLSKTEYKGYAQKSYDLLTALSNSPATTNELLPFVASYQASALSLVSGETRNLKLLSQAFALFDEASNNYSDISYLPEFLRGSVAENLPWFLLGKRKFASIDFASIIHKQEMNPHYANSKTMSFVYWAWANQHQSNKDRQQALQFLQKAIDLDPTYKAGRKKAEELLNKLERQN